jgi:hypothetical protein
MGKMPRGFLVLGFCAVIAPRLATAADVIYTVPGVINGWAVGTLVTCTAVKVAQTVTVEAFDSEGAAAGTGTLSIASNNSRTFATVPVAGLNVDSNLASPTIKAGYAQVSSTSKALVCTAYLADTAHSNPAFVSTLPLFRRTEYPSN